ncbi:MAG: hypothetical protein CMJ59_19845 [Planctomycetaceae bacterium]|nr:hypothetical protein [Planctomycetaceae bacterium]
MRQVFKRNRIDLPDGFQDQPDSHYRGTAATSRRDNRAETIAPQRGESSVGAVVDEGEACESK